MMAYRSHVHTYTHTMIKVKRLCAHDKILLYNTDTEKENRLSGHIILSKKCNKGDRRIII